MAEGQRRRKADRIMIGRAIQLLSAQPLGTVGIKF
jgi:hypothetical protein